LSIPWSNSIFGLGFVGTLALFRVLALVFVLVSPRFSNVVSLFVLLCGPVLRPWSSTCDLVSLSRLARVSRGDLGPDAPLVAAVLLWWVLATSVVVQIASQGLL
jgi:hypothetical protein